MKLILVILFTCLIQFSYGATWYNFVPYNSTFCNDTVMYGVGYSFLGENYCTSNVEGTTHFKTSAVVAGTSVKIDQYVSTNSPKLCTTLTATSTYNLNACQDAKYSGFLMSPSYNNFNYAKNYYVNSSTSAFYPTSTNQNVMLLTFYSIDCNTIIGYQYYKGFTVHHDPLDSNLTYNFFCRNGVPYRQYCEIGYPCDLEENLTQTCMVNVSTYLSKTVTCV